MSKKTMEDVANMKPEKPAPGKKTKTPAAKAPAKEKNRGSKAKSEKKEKPVRGTFTLAKPDYALLAELKEKCRKEGVPYRKNDFIRAGLVCLSSLSMVNLLKAMVKERSPAAVRARKTRAGA